MLNITINTFNFSLAKNTALAQNKQGYFLYLQTPLRILRISGNLFSILSMLQKGNSLSEIVRQHPDTKPEELIKTLITLSFKGYCIFNRSQDLKDYPSVSIIIPTVKLSLDLAECLASLDKLDYPRGKLEILVVADDISDSSLDLSRYNLKIIQAEGPKGPGTARNLGARNATGEILAFLDSDCIADSRWLKDLVPLFEIQDMGAAGGFVDSYYKKGCLDRYEDSSSPLNMGSRIQFEGKTNSNFYLPTCNLLVSRKVFNLTGGFKDGMRVGEDVDFCWRMRNQGYYLFYGTFGKVAHKHRNQLSKMLRRRGFYGTSESILYKSHKEKRKKFPMPICAGLSFLTLTLAILLKNPLIIALILPFLLIDCGIKKINLKKYSIIFPLKSILFSTIRTHFSLYYFVSFHIIRYYLLLAAGVGFLYHPVWYFGGFILILASVVDYAVKKPKLIYPVFLYFYFLEHVAYQIGVFYGCLKRKYFGSYRLSFSRKVN
jgi:mycofactocin glycosyltransferase